ncbi:MAG: hypothetical protein ACOYEW_08090 [Anaerolineae bacterium]
MRAGRPFAVIDLGTAYVKALLVHRGPTSHWSVVGVGTVSYPRRRADGETFPDAHLDAATEALRRARQRALRLAGRELHPATCLISVSSPPALLTLETRESTRDRTGTPISAHEALSLMEQAEEPATLAAYERSERLWPGSRPVWLGPAWYSAAVDGRPVTGLEGFRGAAIRQQVGVASADASVSRWQEWSRSQGAVPFLVSELLWVGQRLSYRPGNLLLDLGAHRTIASFRDTDGGLCQAELPIGGHYFTRYLSLAAGVSPSRAERLKMAYAAGRLKPNSERQTRRVMQRALGTWARRLVTALSRVGKPLPQRWSFTGGGCGLPELSLLPGLLAGDSILRLHRYPVLQALTPDDVCRRVVPGPERLGPAHNVALALADWWVRLSQEAAARARVVRAAALAGKAGFEVDADWLKL